MTFRSEGGVNETPSQKKADVTERPKAFDHVGLLANSPPDMAGLLFISSSDDFGSAASRNPLA
ncbi:MAG: hypothetical protein ACYC4N_29685 [Pirellulaceae bacterium]